MNLSPLKFKPRPLPEGGSGVSQRANSPEGKDDAEHGSSLHRLYSGDGGGIGPVYFSPPPPLSMPCGAPHTKNDNSDGDGRWQPSWALNPWDPQAQLSPQPQMAPHKWQQPSLLDPLQTPQPRSPLQSSADCEGASIPSWLQPSKRRRAGIIPASSVGGCKGRRSVTSGGGRSRSRPARAANGRFMSKTKAPDSSSAGGGANGFDKNDGGCGNGAGTGSDNVADHCFLSAYLLVGHGLNSHQASHCSSTNYA